MMSIWLADVNGRVVQAIVNKNLKQFIYRVSLFFNILTCGSFIDIDLRLILICAAVINCKLSH